MDEYDDLIEEGEELPILGEPAPTKRRRVIARRSPRERSKGVPESLAGEARRQAIAKATGRNLDPPGGDWRDDLSQGDRGKATAALERGGQQPGGGFGLA